MIKFLKWSSLLAVITLLFMYASYWFSLDRDFQHSSETAKLPLFDQSTSSGLVQIDANGFRFRARVAGFGPQSGGKPLVVLLHGFPSTSVTWVNFIPILEKAGYRVVAFDQRGYSPGARPEGLEHYTGGKRVSDVLAIADVIGAEKFHLIGHDFGAITGWVTVWQHPTRILSWTGLSSPHPIALMDAIEGNAEQQRRSWYIKAYQLPWLAEIIYGAFNADKLWLGYGKYPEDKVREHHKVFAEPGAMTAALNWYRAIRLPQSDPGLLADVQIRRPTLFIWGKSDFSMSSWTIDRQKRYIDAPYRLVELDTGHWVVNDELQRVSDEILRHLAKH